MNGSIKKLGVIFCGYGTPSYIDEALSPWIYLRANPQLVGLDALIISAVSVPFAEYKDLAEKGLDIGTPDTYSQGILAAKWQKGEIDEVILEPHYMTEIEARTRALRTLLAAGCDAVALADSDEVYSVDQISRILSFVDLNPWVSWFRVSLKNYVFTKTQYLSEPFCPPRISRVNTNGYELIGFSGDNDFLYEGTVVINGEFKKKQAFLNDLPNMTIPKGVAFVNHYSWLSDENSKKKCAYQNARWGRCSYVWDDKHDCLAFNPSYYRALGQRLPTVRDE